MNLNPFDVLLVAGPDLGLPNALLGRPLDQGVSLMVLTVVIDVSGPHQITSRTTATSSAALTSWPDSELKPRGVRNPPLVSLFAAFERSELLLMRRQAFASPLFHQRLHGARHGTTLPNFLSPKSEHLLEGPSDLGELPSLSRNSVYTRLHAYLCILQ